jgi:prophage tail gpP-like protein
MELEVKGVLYKNFDSAEVKISMDKLVRTFGFGAFSATANPLPFFQGQTCRVKIDGEAVMTGTIEILTVSGSAGSHSIDVQGRDDTAGIMDSSLGNLPDFAATISLKRLCEAVIEHIGLDIKVIDNLKPKLEPFDKAEDQVTPDVAEAAYDYLLKWARKRNVLLTSNGDGDLFFTQPQPATGRTRTVFLRHRADGSTNNVISYTATFDSTGRFNRYIVTSQGNPVLFNKSGNRTNRSVADQTGSTIEDQDVRLGRQLVLVAETAASVGENTTRAEWEANIRKVKGRTYQCEVRGFRNQEGNLWTPGELVFVDDDFAGISAEMRINEVIYTMGSNGFLTNLTCLEPNAYTLTLEEPKEQKVGVGFDSEEE